MPWLPLPTLPLSLTQRFVQVLEDFLAPSGMTADGVALKFSESVQKLARTERDPQMAAMNEVSDMLPDTVLVDYIRAQIPSNDKLWTFRKHLAVQYACQVLVSHALFCAPPTPSKLVLSKLQGDVTVIGAVPGLNKERTKMTDDFAETGAVPFRMTRMMTILLSSVGACPFSLYEAAVSFDRLNRCFNKSMRAVRARGIRAVWKSRLNRLCVVQVCKGASLQQWAPLLWRSRTLSACSSTICIRSCARRFLPTGSHR